MSARLYSSDDFEATIRILGPSEGGRKAAAFNGIRWDFAYADDGSTPNSLYMIWPDFFAVEGRPLAGEGPLPVGPELTARMFVLMDEMRAEVHRARIAPGVAFFCHEGGKRVARGTVTRITGLFKPR